MHQIDKLLYFIIIFILPVGNRNILRDSIPVLQKNPIRRLYLINNNSPLFTLYFRRKQRICNFGVQYRSTLILIFKIYSTLPVHTG